MTTDPEPPWETVLDGPRARYVLPPRRLGGLRVVGVGFIVFAVLFAAIVTGGVLSVAEGPFRLLAIPALLPALGAASVGCLFGFGRSELRLADDELVGVERVGPLRLRRRVRVQDVERFVVQVGPPTSAGPTSAGPTSAGPTAAGPTSAGPTAVAAAGVPAAAGPFAGLAILSARKVPGALGRPSVPLAVGHPRATLEPLARELATRIGRPWEAVGLDFATEPGRVLLPFALVTVVMGAVGVWILYAALRSGRRRALVQVDDGALSIVQQSFGEPESRLWGRGEVTHVGIGPSGIAVNDVPVMELKVQTSSGEQAGYFRERSDDELLWIAAELQAALAAAASPSAEAPAGDPRPSESADARGSA